MTRIRHSAGAGAAGPPGPGQVPISAVASENLAAGALVALWNSAGTLKARNADQSLGVPDGIACGFVSAPALTGATASVFTLGTIDVLSGLTPATRYFLGVTGALTATPGTGIGTLCQHIGIASTATQLIVSLSEPVVTAS